MCSFFQRDCRIEASSLARCAGRGQPGHLQHEAGKEKNPLMTLQFGLFVPQGWRMDLLGIADPVEAYETMTRAAQEAEALGYHSVWLFDHFHTVPTPTQEVTFECDLLIGGGGEQVTLKLVAQYADACNIANVDITTLEHKLSLLKRYCEEMGRDYHSVRRTILLTCALAETEEAALAKIGSIERNAQSAASPAQFRERALIGTPETIRHRLTAYEQAGAQEIILYMPDSAHLESVRLFAHKFIGV
jgi:alkanesulfonate monooxygenase SsuD/methylene tetrahydromethanopterin reductase-like flavin-dependent oxidoreductase (luciferase family)